MFFPVWCLSCGPHNIECTFLWMKFKALSSQHLCASASVFIAVYAQISLHSISRNLHPHQCIWKILSLGVCLCLSSSSWQSNPRHGQVAEYQWLCFPSYGWFWILTAESLTATTRHWCKLCNIFKLKDEMLKNIQIKVYQSSWKKSQ